MDESWTLMSVISLSKVVLGTKTTLRSVQTPPMTAIATVVTFSVESSHPGHAREAPALGGIWLIAKPSR